MNNIMEMGFFMFTLLFSIFLAIQKVGDVISELLLIPALNNVLTHSSFVRANSRGPRVQSQGRVSCGRRVHRGRSQSGFSYGYLLNEGLMGRGGRQGSVPGLSPESQTHENNSRNTETKMRTSDMRKEG